MGKPPQPRRARLGAVLALVASAWAGQAWGLPPVRKTPGGAFVSESLGVYSVPRGQSIEWTVSLCNDTALPLLARIFDQLHGGDCGSSHQYLTLECPPEIRPATAGGTVEVCDDDLAASLDVVDLSVAPAGCVELVFATAVDLLTPPGVTQVCNIAFYSTDTQGSGQTTPPGAMSPACTCVQLEAPLPTELDLDLSIVPEQVPFAGGDPSSTALLTVEAVNLSPRTVVGTLVVPVDDGVAITEILECPEGASCTIEAGGGLLVEGLAVPEAGSFRVLARLTADCASYGRPELCSQASFLPDEDPGAVVFSDHDSALAGDQPTCFAVASEDLSRSVKTWELIDDADGDGVASRGDRVRFDIRAWNSGTATAHDVVVTDGIPLGFDRATVIVDPSGSYDGLTATWNLASLGPGSVADLWLEATLTANNPCNKARLASRERMACLGTDVSTDDPFTPIPEDSTCPMGPGHAAPHVSKSFRFVDSDGDGVVDAGERVDFLIEVVNEGVVAATGVVLEDLLAACWQDLSPASVSIEPPDGGVNASSARALRIEQVGGPDGLAPLERVVVRFDLSSGAPAGCCNRSFVTWDGSAVAVPSDDPRTIGGAPDATCLSLPAGPVPRLSKRALLIDGDGDGVPGTGDRLRYTLTVANEGTGPLTGIALSDELPLDVMLDEASIAASPVGSLVPRIVPAPGGAFGSGRIEVPIFDLAAGEQVRLDFEVRLLGGGRACNRAALSAPGLLSPLLSEDEDGGAATCVDVVSIPLALLDLRLAAEGPLTEGCALPGEEVGYVLTWTIGGDAEARASQLVLDHSPLLSLLDADGAAEVLSGRLRWELGDLPLGDMGMRSPTFGSSCDQALGASLAATASLSSDSALSPATAMLAPVVLAQPVLEPVLSLVHDDTNGDGTFSPGESVALELRLEEVAGCDAEQVRVVVELTPELEASMIEDGGSLVGSTIVWEAPAATDLERILAFDGIVLRAELVLSALAADCAIPTATTRVEWPASPGAGCPRLSSWEESDRALPQVDCVATEPVDLLREDSTSSLGPGGPTPAMVDLLDPVGNWNGCDGESPRIDPARLLLSDAETALQAGVVAPGDAQPVGEGRAGVLILYEAAASCANLRVCKVDDDGDPVNGRESILLTTGSACDP